MRLLYVLSAMLVLACGAMLFPNDVSNFLLWIKQLWDE
jgi:hypothetical protein